MQETDDAARAGEAEGRTVRRAARMYFADKEDTVKELDNYRSFMKNLPEEIREAEIEAEKEIIVSAAVTDGGLAGMTYSELVEGFVRASAERTGMVYTQNLEADPAEIAARALENGKFSNCEGKECMNGAQDIGAVICEKEPEAVSAAELAGAAERLMREIRSVAELAEGPGTDEQRTDGSGTDGAGRQMMRAQIGISQNIRTKCVINSKGVDETASSDFILAEIHLFDPNAGAGYESWISAPSPELLSAEGERRKLLRWNRTKLAAAPFQSGTYRVLLDQTVTTNIFMHAWRLFSANAYASGSSAYSGKLGQKIMPDFITISDKPDTKESAFRYRIDCEGSVCSETKLVENGVLTGLMHNLSTAEEAGCKTTGNAGRKTSLSGNIHTDMLVMPTNFVMEPGERSFDELLELLGDGIYINESLDVHHSLEIASGKFAIPCEGILVKNGKMTGKVTGLSMNGNLKDLFAGIVALGDELNFRPFDMYQSYVLMGPAMVVDGIEVVG